MIKKYPEIAARLSAQLDEWSQELDPPGLDHPLGQAGNKYFDHYLNGKEASHPKFPLEAVDSKKDAPSRGRRPSAATMLKKRDRDKDGRLTLDEYIGNPTNRNVPALKRQFKNRDKDGDGFLGRSELEEANNK